MSGICLILYRAAAQEKLSADDLMGELKSSLGWSEGAMAVVRHVWKEEGPALISMPQETLSVGQVSIEYIDHGIWSFSNNVGTCQAICFCS